MSELSNVNISRNDVAYMVSLLSLREKQLKRDVNRLNEQFKNGEISEEMYEQLITVVHEERQQAQLLHDDIMNQINKQVYK
jgi:hypothetical protein